MPIIRSSTHGQQRRGERLIHKAELEAALKYGKVEVSYDSGYRRYIYTHNDIVFVTDEHNNEITSWVKPGAGIAIPKKEITERQKRYHKYHCHSDRVWTSHTVFIVDQSGSMRKLVNGGATRSDTVWKALAIDLIEKQLNNETMKPTDVVTVITMGTTSKIVIDCQPYDWILFNDVIDLLYSSRAVMHGNYLPAMNLAESILLDERNGNKCSLSLFFLSDGKPSDRDLGRFSEMIKIKEELCSCVDKMLKVLGKRLSILTVGFAPSTEDFSVLKAIASRPIKFGGKGEFMLAPDMSAGSLQIALTSLISSITESKLDLSKLNKNRTLRKVSYEAIDDNENNWNIYYGKDDNENKRCLGRFKWDSENNGWKPIDFISEEATGVVFKPSYFASGAERLVTKFHEINSKLQILGPKLVAKESLYTEEMGSYEFHKSFCITQQRAQRYA